MSASHFSGPVVSEGGVQVGSSGSTISLVKKATVSVDLASINAGAVVEATVTVSGAAAGDSVVATPPAAIAAGLAVVGAYVSAANTVKLRVLNSTGGAIDEAAADWVFTLIR